jgi:hypothetical protein
MNIKDIAEIIYGVLSLAGIFAGLYFAWRNYKREEAYNAVLTVRSSRSFQKPISLCEKVLLEIENCSKHTTSMAVDIYSNCFSLHYEHGDGCPSYAYNGIRPEVLVVGPNECFRQNFRVHTLTNLPEVASITVHLNGKLFERFIYVYDYNQECYLPGRYA